MEGWLVPGRNPFGLYLHIEEVDALAAAFGREVLGENGPENKSWGMLRIWPALILFGMLFVAGCQHKRPDFMMRVTEDCTARDQWACDLLGSLAKAQTTIERGRKVLTVAEMPERMRWCHPGVSGADS